MNPERNTVDMSWVLERLIQEVETAQDAASLRASLLAGGIWFFSGFVLGGLAAWAFM